MKTPTKFVKPLTSEQRDQLMEIMKSPAPQRTRMRAHAILLSERRYSIDQISDIYQVDRDRVSQWLDWWEEYNFDGLDDDPRGGRPPKLNQEEQKRAIGIVRKEPRSIKKSLKRIADEVGKLISGDTLKNILKAGGHTWKRMRRGLRFFRDEEEFREAEAELARLRAESLLPASEFDLWYCDEAGFTLEPSCPLRLATGGGETGVGFHARPASERAGLFQPGSPVPLVCLRRLA